MGKDDYMGILQAEACPAASDGCFRNRDRGVLLFSRTVRTLSDDRQYPGMESRARLHYGLSDIFRKLPDIVLGLLVAAAGFLTLDLCLNLNVFGLLTEARNVQMYTPIGGWSMTGEQLYIGLTRLLYPFLAGLLREWLKKF